MSIDDIRREMMRAILCMESPIAKYCEEQEFLRKLSESIKKRDAIIHYFSFGTWPDAPTLRIRKPSHYVWIDNDHV